MNRCPRERQATGAQCKVRGCDHRCARVRVGQRSVRYVARICLCCIARCGSTAMTKMALIRHMGSAEAIARFEDELLVRLAGMEPRMIEARGDGKNHNYRSPNHRALPAPAPRGRS